MNFITGNVDNNKENLLIAEISCHYGDEMWNRSNEEVFSLCIKDLDEDNLLKKEDILSHEIIKMPNNSKLQTATPRKNKDTIVIKTGAVPRANG